MPLRTNPASRLFTARVRKGNPPPGGGVITNVRTEGRFLEPDTAPADVVFSLSRIAGVESMSSYTSGASSLAPQQWQRHAQPRFAPHKELAMTLDSAISPPLPQNAASPIGSAESTRRFGAPPHRGIGPGRERCQEAIATASCVRDSLARCSLRCGGGDCLISKAEQFEQTQPAGAKSCGQERALWAANSQSRGVECGYKQTRLAITAAARPVPHISAPGAHRFPFIFLFGGFPTPQGPSNAAYTERQAIRKLRCCAISGVHSRSTVSQVGKIEH